MPLSLKIKCSLFFWFYILARRILEGYASKKLRFEEQALVIAIRDTFLPRMQGRDASVFITLVTDVWPTVDVPMVFRGDDDILEKLPDSQSRVSSKNSSRIRTAKSAESTKSVRGKEVFFLCTYMWGKVSKYYHRSVTVFGSLVYFLELVLV